MRCCPQLISIVQCPYCRRFVFAAGLLRRYGQSEPCRRVHQGGGRDGYMLQNLTFQT